MSHREHPAHTDPVPILQDLFHRAREKDEFEYCCSLLRIRGMADPGWDPLEESRILARQLLSVVETPIEGGYRLRLLLFLYAHLTEMRDVYHIVGNMLRVCHGERYSLLPFGTPRKGQSHWSPSAKVKRIREFADAVALSAVAELLEDMLVREVRNAFYHSDYTLRPDSLHIVEGEGVRIGNVIERRVKYDWLIPRLELGINTSLAVIDLTIEHIRSYQSDKVVRGRFGPSGSFVDLQLTTRAGYGLTGFRSPPDPRLRAKPSDNQP